MANHVDIAAISAIPITNYSSIRGTIQNGDLIFCAGNYFISKQIERVTNSPWSHVGILFNLTSIDRVLMLESIEDMDVRLAPISKYMSNYENGSPYDGSIVLARYNPTLTDDNIKDISDFGIDQLTHPYDKSEVAEIALRTSLGIGRIGATPGTFICSELVSACFQKAGINFNISGSFISPEDICS